MKKQMTTRILSRVLKMTVILSVMLYTLPSLAQPACSAHFKNQAGNTLNSVRFSAAVNAPSTRYSWTFGDGTTSTQMNPVHTYPSGGVYYACLTIKDSSSHGVCTDSWCDSVRIGTPPPPPPVCNAHFTIKPGHNGSGTSFMASQNPPGTKYSWDFGDGTTGVGNNPNHTYAIAGVYYACLTVRDSSASGICTDTKCDSVHVGNPPPPPACNAHFTFKPGTTLKSLNFQSSLNPPGSTYSWDFGDGNTSTVKNPSETFPDTGIYYVCLTVIDSLGTCTNTWCDSVRIGKGKPHVNPNLHPCNAHFKYRGDSILYHIRFQSALNRPGTTYSWDFGDGNTSNLANPNNTYASAGVYYVCLTVNDSACTNTWCDSVRVGIKPPPPPPPHACDAHFKYRGDSTQTVKFTNAPNSPKATYSWDFGDGNTSSGANPAHTYTTKGVYWVCLTVTDSTPNGPCTNTWCDSVRSDRPFFHQMAPPPCPNSKINASVFPNPMSENSSIHIDNSSGNVTFRVFDHNGGVRTTQQLGNGDFRISKENLIPGVHFYEILDSDGNVTRGKFIVQ